MQEEWPKESELTPSDIIKINSFINLKFLIMTLLHTNEESELEQD